MYKNSAFIFKSTKIFKNEDMTIIYIIVNHDVLTIE